MPETIGIIGGGQLGRMLAIAARNLGFRTVVLDPTPESPAGEVADMQIIGHFKDADKIREVAGLADVITFEIESANADALGELVASGHSINPSPRTLSMIKDKYAQKKFLEKNDIPVSPAVEVADKGAIHAAAANFDYALFLKARRDVYDGRGNALVRNASEIDAAMKKLQGGGLYVEKLVPFVKELAVVVARGKVGEILPYPVVETIHRDSVCRLVLSPAPVPAEVAAEAERLAIRILSLLQGVGVFCIEMFLTEQNDLIVNEIAPRVHNSGHHTIEGHRTSQFEQHIRAVSGMPLGDISRSAPISVMVNILGERSGPAMPHGLEAAAEIPGAFIHIYNKRETRPGRKMGHITVIGSDLEIARENAILARSKISI